jgi:23S rRNA pseudouridine1911/1915/1917 synthase
VPRPAANQRIRVRIAREDPRTLVVVKMPGVATEPGRGHRDASLLNGLFAHDGGRFAAQLARLGEERDWGLLHRLDRPTSGLLLVALDVDAWTSLRAAFEARTIDKTYLAIVRGDLAAAEGTIDRPLAERIVDGYRTSVLDPTGRPAITRYRTLARAGRYALVACELVTGRLHQIRVHLASLGAPVAGDPIYQPGGRANVGGRNAKDPKLHLHAWKLAFPHPDGGARIAVETPPPRDFATFAREHDLPIDDHAPSDDRAVPG